MSAQRVAIVYSESSAASYYDRFVHNQLFAAVQNQARMAGIPYDLLNEDDLTDVNKLLGHQVLIFPYMPRVKAAKQAAIEAALDAAVTTHRMGIITSGRFMTKSETGTDLADPYNRMNRWLGLTTGGDISGLATNMVIQNATHPATRDYALNEKIASWKAIWSTSFPPAAGQAATVLANLTATNLNLPGVVATTMTAGGRNVHFANEEVMGCSNLLWSCLQWAVYGDQTPVALNLGRMKGLFASRTDMDQSMFVDEVNSNEVPLLNLLGTWKANYNFVGSYYINVGNNPAAGETTNWAVSGPLYQQYRAMGNEIGTHSYTHPDATATLNATELEFEFNQSKNVISSQLGFTVTGAAIPGAAESVAVQQQLDNYFGHVSGRYGYFENSFQGGIGRLTPTSKAIYWSLNMLPDFTLIEDMKVTPAQALAEWQRQMTAIAKHAQMPLTHWLWHDYAPTSSAALYTVGLIQNTIATASSSGMEFATVGEITDRIRSFEGATLNASGTTTLTASVTGQGLGQFSLRPPAHQPISQVANWYAYDNGQVFLPETGGSFTISLGSTPAAVTRITQLPMRARLLSANGNGDTLTFSFAGEGVVTVSMSPNLAAGHHVSGASSFTRTGNQLSLVFSGPGPHTATLSNLVVGNLPPTAANQSVTTAQAIPASILLGATDPEGAPLTYAVVTNPASGQLTGTAPNLTYRPNAGFTGSDSFTFIANDSTYNSNVATVSLNVVSTTVQPVTLTTQISAGADDAEQSSDGSVRLTSSDLELLTDGTDVQVVGLRFPGLNIPPGAHITNATLQFKVDETQSVATSVRISAQAADNAPVFTATTQNLSSRPRTTSSVVWAPPAWTTLGATTADQRPPNLAQVMQEVVSRPGWATGNALAFILTGTGHRTAESFETGNNGAPVLTISYLPTGTYSHWLRNQTALTGNHALRTANPDGDALNNLLEYALASPPLRFNTSPFTVSREAGHLTFTYTRPSQAADLSYTVEHSPTLSNPASWSAVGVPQQILSDNGVIRTLRASVPSTSGKGFVRLKVSTEALP